MVLYPRTNFPLIENVVSNVKAGDVVELLRGSDARMLIDIMDEVRVTFFRIRGDCKISPL
jgi:hypothetical protein